MKCLIILAFVAVAQAAPQYYQSFAIPTVLPDGHLADTPEVAVAKIAHFAEHAKALAASPAPVVTPVVSHFAAPVPAVVASPYFRSSSPFYNPATGPFAIPTILPDGHLADTPEVAVAKAIHFSEHAKALSLSAF